MDLGPEASELNTKKNILRVIPFRMSYRERVSIRPPFPTLPCREPCMWVTGGVGCGMNLGLGDDVEVF